MLESTPGSPYTGCVRDLLLVEPNMRLRCVAGCPFQPPTFQQEIDTLAGPPKAAPGTLKFETQPGPYDPDFLPASWRPRKVYRTVL
jgi:hypothetical protein